MAERKEIIEVAGKVHVRAMRRSMSAASRAEIFASGGWTEPDRYVRAMLNRSVEAYALRSPGGDLLAVFGVLAVDRQWSAPWVVTTEQAAEFPVLMLHMARETLDAWRNLYPNMIMHMHGLDTKGLRLAAALGLRPETPEVKGPQRALFSRIVIEAKKLMVG